MKKKCQLVLRLNHYKIEKNDCKLFIEIIIDNNMYTLNKFIIIINLV